MPAIMELYNGEESIADTLGTKLAQVSSSGQAYWSRPGVLKALCNFHGLNNFPFDTLTCSLEFGGWALGGDVQDLMPMKFDGGISWSGNGEVSETQGVAFQDYTIERIHVERKVLYYSGGSTPWPELLYTLRIQRAGPFYISKLVVPQIAMACLSVVTYWLNPCVGERLGFGFGV